MAREAGPDFIEALARGLDVLRCFKVGRPVMTLSEIAAQYQVHVKLVQAWKKQMLEQAATVFTSGVKPAAVKDTAAQQAELFEQIGRLKMELEWVKKKLPPSCEWKRSQIEPSHRS